jgi:hypothetical protein
LLFVEVSSLTEVSMYNTPTGHAVRNSLMTIATSNVAANDGDRALLRTRIGAAVDELKAMGWSIERIIIRLKDVVDECGLPSRFPTNRNSRETVKSEAVRVCIERYFDR